MNEYMTSEQEALKNQFYDKAGDDLPWEERKPPITGWYSWQDVRKKLTDIVVDGTTVTSVGNDKASTLAKTGAKLILGGYDNMKYVLKRTQDRYITKDYQMSLKDGFNKAYKVASEEVGMNHCATYTVGRKTPEGDVPITSVPIVLKGGYDANVIAADSSKKPEGVVPLDVRFYTSDHETFREMNAYMSGDASERKEQYKKKGENDVKAWQTDDNFQKTYGESYDTFMEHVRNAPNDPELYVDVTGAPYVYDHATGEMYPTTIRYTGKSMERVVNCMNVNKQVSQIGKKTKKEPDIVDFAHAHGEYRNDLFKKNKRAVKPETRIDPSHPEMFTEKNRLANMRQWVKTTAAGALKQLREIPAAIRDKFQEKDRSTAEQLAAVEAEMEALSTETDGVAPVARPVVEAQQSVDGYATGDFPEETLIENEVFSEYPREPVTFISDSGAETPRKDSVVPKKRLTPKQQTALRAMQLNELYTKKSVQHASTKTLTTPNPIEQSPSLD